MSNAESTVKFAILNGLIQNWHRKNEPNFSEIAQQEIFENLFAPHLKWAVEEYLTELSQTKS